MIKELLIKVFRQLRDAAGYTQAELGVASGLSRRTVQRIERAERLPTLEEEEAILMATDSTLLSAAEVVCKELGKLIGHRVTIVADEADYQAATPEGELTQLMDLAFKKMPRDRWWAWKERVGHYKALGQLYEAQGLSHVRDLKAEAEALYREEEP